MEDKEVKVFDIALRRSTLVLCMLLVGLLAWSAQQQMRLNEAIEAEQTAKQYNRQILIMHEDLKSEMQKRLDQTEKNWLDNTLWRSRHDYELEQKVKDLEGFITERLGEREADRLINEIESH